MLDELQLAQLQSAPGAKAIIDGREMLYFGGTGYLGLQGHPEVIEAGCEALRRYGVHSATTRTNFGNPAAIAVEHLAAELTGTEDAFYFPTGYLGSQVLLRALESDFDTLLVDEQAHYSVHEAARHSQKPVVRFRHRDAGDLRDQLAGLEKTVRPLVMCDGVSPVSGAIAPLGEYCALLADHGGAGLLVDDAHGFGVLGARGLGTWEHCGFDPTLINREPDELPQAPRAVRQYCTVTLSKAVGGHGGLIVGSRKFIRRIKQQQGIYLGGTPPAAPVAGASAAGLRLALGDSRLRNKLAENVAMLRRGLRSIGLPCEESPVPIVGLSLDSAERMANVQRELFRTGIAIGYLRTYTNLGPHGALRIAVFAAHEAWMIEKLVTALKELIVPSVPT